MRGGIARDSEAAAYLEQFLVCAVLSIVTIRTYLLLTGYPQIGGKGVHIAHMLFGGAMMVGAIFALVAFLGRGVRHFAAILGGVGFGFFIDELGKFITSDNNYFFRPTFGLLYLIFVALSLIARAIARARPLSQREYLLNAAATLVDLLERGATPEEMAAATAFLDRSGEHGPLAESLRGAFAAAALQWQARTSPFVRLRAASGQGYRWLVGRRWFQRALTVIFVADAVAALALAIADAVGVGWGAIHRDTRTFVATGNLVASALAAAMIVIGALRLRRSRRSAYRWFKNAMLVAIFVVQPYRFFADQLGALGGMLVDFVLLISVDYLLAEERAAQQAALHTLHGPNAAVSAQQGTTSVS